MTDDSTRFDFQDGQDVWWDVWGRNPEILELCSADSTAYNLSAKFTTMKSQPIREIV
ncbi:MAG: hypothetical protein WBR56_20285 [Sedimenticolaceae bacterium]